MFQRYGYSMVINHNKWGYRQQTWRFVGDLTGFIF
jgi:hypothetical protein